MKRFLWTLLFLLAGVLCLDSCRQKEVRVVLETTMGNIELKLYDATPLHRDNFRSLVQ